MEKIKERKSNTLDISGVYIGIYMQNREQLSSRLGFILLSAGCAIGLGNIWRFPYVTGMNGGGLFVLLYIFFLVILGLPIVVMEFSVGRASRKSVALSFDVLEKKGSKWHYFKYFGMAGNYILMMFYTTMGGWMIAYFVKMIKGDFTGKTTAQVKSVYDSLTSNTGEMVFWMILVVVIGFGVCSLGLQKGVERITKYMMSCLFLIMIAIIIRVLTLPDAMEGLKFYLLPDLKRAADTGMGNVISAAMGQAFFTLSIGIGSLAIFGSYIGKEKRLLSEAVSVASLDTAVALIAGLMIFPACSSFGVEPSSGSGLVFLTLPNIFNSMAGGRIWGSLFFIFMSFAALSTIIAVFQNIISFSRDLWNWSIKKSVLVNGILMVILSLPCIFGMTIWKDFTLLGKDIMGFEDFLVSNNFLPLGSLVYLLFCVTRYGWGWDKFLEEANTGNGMKFPRWIYPYLLYGLPIIVLIIFIQGYLPLFQ